MKTTEHKHPAVTTVLRKEIQSPPAYDVNTVYQEAERNCSNNPSCLKKALTQITEKYGPAASLETLRMLQENGRLSMASDHHDVAHEMGLKTAERFGINGQAFLLCPTSFNYGCQHGFFEYALGKAGTGEKAATLICGSLDNSYSSKFKFYCYHGLGHGVMMAKNYNLKEALTTCDALDSRFGQDGCWQGVFMENINAGTRGDRRASSFSKTDALAPCNVVPDKYRHECFVNHAGWLMKFFSKDLKKATSACLQAPGPYVSSCLQSLGLMVTSPAWQAMLLGSGKDKRFEEAVWTLCTQFPKNHQDQCVVGAVDNILNFDELEVSRARNFCNTVGAAYKNLCYHRIGVSLRNQATDLNVVRQRCATFRGDFEEHCLQGAATQRPGAVHSHHHSSGNGLVERKFNDSTEKDSKEIFRNDDALFSYVKKFGLKQTITRLHELAPQYGDCHGPAHRAGRFAYKIYSTQAFRPVVGECHAGGFHGAIEAYFKEHGTANLSDDVKVMCGSELNRFFKHQCIHGIGHGLMAASNYELFFALKGCDLLSEMQPSCWTGVFMENIGGSLGNHGGHSQHSKYLSDDPHYPCTIVGAKYKPSCYYLQTSRMMRLFKGDFSKVASACSEAPKPYQRACFESMGRDVGGVHRGNPPVAIASCSYAPKGAARLGCLVGAAQDQFWDRSGQDNAISFCKELKARAEKDACYKTIFARAPLILTSKEDLKTLCSKAEAPYRDTCRNKIVS